jgi:iron-sulfur cluster repair protein YtfE (RIC family)
MTNGAWHTEDEEQSVFPRLLPRLEYGARARLAQLELQHREAHRLLDKLVALIGAPVPGTAWMARVRGVVGPLAALYREHIAVEEEILIVLCREHLDGSDLAAISDEMRARRQAA